MTCRTPSRRSPGGRLNFIRAVGADMTGRRGAGGVAAIPAKSAIKIYDCRICVPVSPAVIGFTTGATGSMTVSTGDTGNRRMGTMATYRIRVGSS